MKTLSLILAVLLPPAIAQDLGSLDRVPVKTRQYVSYISEPQLLPVGKGGVLELHFRVLDSFHVNSHTPGSTFLIPTKLELDGAEKLRISSPEYPAGKPYSFSFDSGNQLDVYADDFTVRIPVSAPAGSWELHGTLRYQACDKALCYPPRSLPVSVLFTAK